MADLRADLIASARAMQPAGLNRGTGLDGDDCFLELLKSLTAVQRSADAHLACSIDLAQ